jgi:hypothetical protein
MNSIRKRAKLFNKKESDSGRKKAKNGKEALIGFCYLCLAMGHQQVLGMVLLHCISRMQQHIPHHLQCRTLVETRLINRSCHCWKNRYLQCRTLVQTCLISWSCHCWKNRWKASFGIFLSLAITFDLMSPVVAKHVPLILSFKGGNSQKSLGVWSWEYNGWVMTGLFSFG